MAITNGYTDRATVKVRAGIPTDITDDDTTIDAVVTAVSRSIDQFCGTRFYVVANEVRYFTARRSDQLLIDDCVLLAALATDDDGARTYETTWASTDYDLEPANAAVKGEPYWQIRLAPNGRYSFPSIARGVKLTGSFGYAASTPAVVGEACIIQSLRIFKRKDSPFGVAGSPDTGMIRLPRLDVDVQMLLSPMRRMTVA